MASDPSMQVERDQQSDRSLSPISAMQQEWERVERAGGISCGESPNVIPPDDSILVVPGKQKNTLSFIVGRRYRMNRVNVNNTNVTIACVIPGFYLFFFFCFVL